MTRSRRQRLEGGAYWAVVHGSGSVSFVFWGCRLVREKIAV